MLLLSFLHLSISLILIQLIFLHVLVYRVHPDSFLHEAKVTASLCGDEGSLLETFRHILHDRIIVRS